MIEEQPQQVSRNPPTTGCSYSGLVALRANRNQAGHGYVGGKVNSGLVIEGQAPWR